MSGTAERRMLLKLGGDVTDLKRAALEGERSITKFGEATEKKAGLMSRAWQSMGTKMAAVAGGHAVLSFFKNSIDGASDLAESTSKCEVVFGKSADKVKAFGKQAATSLGMSKTQAYEATGTFGNLLTSIGITSDAAVDMSTDMVTLAGDLASFNNSSPEETLLALRSALTGETEPMKRFGVALSAAAVESKALSMGLVQTREEITPAVKAQATYALILEQTSNAQGDFSRTSEGAANQQRILAAQAADISAEFGQKLLPATESLMGFLSSVGVPVVSVLAQAFGSVVKIGGDLLGFIAESDEALKLLGVTITSLSTVHIGRMVKSSGVFKLLATEIGGVGREAGGLKGVFLGVRNEGGSHLAALGASAATAGKRLATGLGGAARGVMSLFGGPWGLALTAAAAGLAIWTSHKKEAEEATRDYIDALGQDTDTIGENTRTMIANRLQKTGLLDYAKRLGVGAAELSDAITGEGDAWDRLTDKYGSVKEAAQLKSYADRESLGLTEKQGLAASALILKLNEERKSFDEAATKHRELTGAKKELDDAAKQQVATGEQERAKATEVVTALEGVRSATFITDKTVESFGTTVDGVNFRFKQTSDSAGELRQEVDYLNGSFLSSEEAAINYKDSIAQLSEKILANGATIDLNSSKGRENRSAILDASRAAQSHAQAVLEESGSLRDANAVMVSHKQELEGQLQKLGLLTPDVQAYVDKLYTIPKSVQTKIDADTSQAAGKVASLLQDMGRKISLSLWGINWTGRASGGLVHGPGGPTDDRIPTLLSAGEYVVSARGVRSVGAAFLDRINTGGGSIPLAATGHGQGAGAAPTVNNYFTVHVDGQLVDPMGAGAAMADILTRYAAANGQSVRFN